VREGLPAALGQVTQCTIDISRRRDLTLFPAHDRRPDDTKFVREFSTGHLELGAELGDMVDHDSKSAFCTLAVKCLMHSSQWQKSAMSTPAERLTWARKQAGYEGPAEAARAMGISRFTYAQHENGIRGFKSDSAVRYARRFRVSYEWLTTGKGDAKVGIREIPVTRYVGAGAEVYPFSDQGELDSILL
jgi:DNA-binding XRE family transcriptional regulator